MTITRTFLDRAENAATGQTSVVSANVNTVGAKALVVAFKVQEGTFTDLSASDSQGNTWELIDFAVNGTNQPRAQMWWCRNPTTSASHNFTGSVVGGSSDYLCLAVWKIDATGQVVLDDYRTAVGTSTAWGVAGLARISDAVHLMMCGEFTSNTVSALNGWTEDETPGGTVTRIFSRVETGNGKVTSTVTMTSSEPFAAVAASFREITGTLVDRDVFTVGSDIALASYPSGAAEWANQLGTAVTVNATRDRVEESTGNGDQCCRYTGAGAPTDRQRVAAMVGWNTVDESGCLLVRANATGGGNFYLLQRASATQWGVWSYKSGSWSGPPIVYFNAALADAGRALISFEAETNGSQVTLRAIIDGTLYSFNDTLGDRILSGTNGIGVYSTSGSTNNFVDNVVIENPDIVSITITVSATEGADTSDITINAVQSSEGQGQDRNSYGSAPYGSRGWLGAPAAGGGDVTLTISATEGNDASSLPVTQVVTANISATEGADTSSIPATVRNTVNIAATEGADTSSIQATLTVTMNLAATEGPDTSSIPVDVQGAGVEATLAATEGDDTAAFQTTVTDRLTLTALEGDDASALMVTVRNLLTISAAEGLDTSDITASIAANVEALLQAIEANDFSSITIEVFGAVVASSDYKTYVRRRRT